MAFDKTKRRKRIKYRINKRISGTPEIPLTKDIKDDDKTTKTDKAKKVGKIISEKALNANIKNVVFDRNGYLYHGRVKALADSARGGGLIF